MSNRWLAERADPVPEALRMDQTNLGKISTLWGLVKQAHGDDSAAAHNAKEQLLQRYETAVKHFLKSILPRVCSSDIEDLYQEFALRFIRGGFHRADPGSGRFRDYVAKALWHMVSKYRRSLPKRPGPLSNEYSELLAVDPDMESFDQKFVAEWRAELMDRAWKALAKEERRLRAPYDAVLRLRAQNPDVPVAELAEQLSRKMGKPMTAANFRQILDRARDKFAKLLVADVAQSLADATPERLQEELHDLGLLKYCASVFRKAKE